MIDANDPIEGGDPTEELGKHANDLQESKAHDLDCPKPTTAGWWLGGGTLFTDQSAQLSQLIDGLNEKGFGLILSALTSASPTEIGDGFQNVGIAVMNGGIGVGVVQDPDTPYLGYAQTVGGNGTIIDSVPPGQILEWDATDQQGIKFQYLLWPDIGLPPAVIIRWNFPIVPGVYGYGYRMALPGGAEDFQWSDFTFEMQLVSEDLTQTINLPFTAGNPLTGDPGHGFGIPNPLDGPVLFTSLEFGGSAGGFTVFDSVALFGRRTKFFPQIIVQNYCRTRTDGVLNPESGFPQAAFNFWTYQITGPFQPAIVSFANFPQYPGQAGF